MRTANDGPLKRKFIEIKIKKILKHLCQNDFFTFFKCQKFTRRGRLSLNSSHGPLRVGVLCGDPPLTIQWSDGLGMGKGTGRS